MIHKAQKLQVVYKTLFFGGTLPHTKGVGRVTKGES